MKTFFLSGIFFLLLFSFSGCEDDEVVDDDTTEENKAPVADAGEDLTGNTGSTIGLSGSGSSDPDEDELTYSWVIKTKPETSQAVVTNPDNMSASFVPDVAGTYTIELTVSDGELSDTDEVLAEVEGTPPETVVVNADINKETVWEDIFTDPLIPDYLVEKNVAVNAKLTVEPGVVVHFKDEVIMTVATGGGSFVAEGAEDNRIIFTSADEAGEVLWGGLLVKSTSSENKISYADIAFGGGRNLVYASGWRQANIGIDEKAKLNISNSSISQSGGDGIFIVRTGSLTTFDNNTFSRNDDFPLSLSINQVGNLTATNVFNDDDATDNRENVIRIYDSVLEDDQEWSDVGGDVTLRFVGNASIEAKLTINEGVSMEFDQEVILEVTSDGTLIAKGIEDNKVVMTSSDTQAGKKWGGILIKSTSVLNELDHVAVLHAGGRSNLVYFKGWEAGNVGLEDGARLRLTNSEIAHSHSHGLVADGSAGLPAFGNNNFHDNDGYAVLLPSDMAGMVDAETTIENNAHDVVAIFGTDFTGDAAFNDDTNPQWTALKGEAKYLITENLNVSDDLVLQEGTYLSFSDGVVMYVTTDGSLKAIGTTDKKVVLTAYEQDGNHNWGGIVFKSMNSNNQLQNTEVSYGGNKDNLVYISGGGWKSGNIGVGEDATLEISSSGITNSQGHGLAIHPESNVTIGEGVTFSDIALEDVYEVD